jgi:hypothetical protein
MFYERPGKKGVEEAKTNLQKAIDLKKFQRPALQVQGLFRSFLSSQVVSSKMQSSVESKLQDLKKLKQILGDKLKALPLNKLIHLIRCCKIAKNRKLVIELKDWIQNSLDSDDITLNLLGTPENWNLFVFVAVSYAECFSRNKDISKYLVNLMENHGKVEKFYMFLLLMQLCSQSKLLSSVQRHLEREILLSPQNLMNEGIKTLLDFIVITHNLYYSVDTNQLKLLDKKMVYEGFVEIQNFIVENILSIPRISKFLLNHPGFFLIRWKEMIQSYYYGNLALKPLTSRYNEKEIFLFGNLWEIFQNKLFTSMSPSDLAHFLTTCTRLVRNLTPSVLECSSNATITESENLKTLRKQISLFTDFKNIPNLFMKVLGSDSHLDSDLNEVAALSLCEIYNIFLEKCQDSKDAQFVVAGITGGVAFNKNCLYKLWAFLISYSGLQVFLDLQSLNDRSSKVYSYGHALALFASSFKNYLLISNDSEFPFIFTRSELQEMTYFCIKFSNLLAVYGKQENFLENIYRTVTSLLTLLHDFNLRLAFIPEEHFFFDDSSLARIVSQNDLVSRVLNHFPFAIPFEQRANILMQKISDTKGAYQMVRGIRIIVRRDRFLDDSINQLLHVDDLRGRLEVQFINSAGTVEDGFDAGGLFKEFWTSLSQEVFRPDYGLFSSTKDHCLYPNSNSSIFFGMTHLSMFQLVGRIIGKAIFERITIEPKFAEFFLQKMTGKHNFLEDLKSLDQEIYNNLMFLKNYEGNCEDLSLTFTVNNLDGSEHDLKPKGSEIAVTSQNKLEYIYKLADYKLNQEIRPQCSAFFKGFNELVPCAWLASFTAGEMQRLISGTSEEIDLNDLKVNTRYIDCSSFDSTVKNFWKCMESFNNDERKMVLKFVTSCHRPPLLGFKNLHPQFTVSKSPISRDDEKLPTAQTCMNILRIPTYSSWKVMKEKLLIAIKSGAGFEFR